MSTSDSSDNRTSTSSQYTYRDENLWVNAVEFMTYRGFLSHPLRQRFRGQVDSLIRFLRMPLDTTVIISPERIAAMQQNFETIIFQDGGYRNAACIEKAFELSEIAEQLQYAPEKKWMKFFVPLWFFFDMDNTFSTR